MILLGAFASRRPEELAELRRKVVDLDEGSIWAKRAAPELTACKRVLRDPKSRAGKREIVLPQFVLTDLRQDMDWFAEPGREGLVFVGERGAPFRRSTFGRKYCKAREKVGLPEEFRFYDLLHTGNTLAADNRSQAQGPHGPRRPGQRAADVRRQRREATEREEQTGELATVYRLADRICTSEASGAAAESAGG
ncbi:hypothetical protein T261_8357 [Streptomyces lydicus]|nr:hypothetical protein T261_8357 [Streptomyces lydicus]